MNTQSLLNQFMGQPGQTAKSDNGSAASAPTGVAQKTEMTPQQTFVVPDQQPARFELCLVKAMIAAAKADGHIDSEEQQRIFKAVDQMDLTNGVKATLFDLLSKDITVAEIASGAQGLEQKTELYLASCMVINPDHSLEQAYLEKLAHALQLPTGLADHLQQQAQQALSAGAQ